MFVYANNPFQLSFTYNKYVLHIAGVCFSKNRLHFICWRSLSQFTFSVVIISKPFHTTEQLCLTRSFHTLHIAYIHFSLKLWTTPKKKIPHYHNIQWKWFCCKSPSSCNMHLKWLFAFSSTFPFNPFILNWIWQKRLLAHASPSIHSIRFSNNQYSWSFQSNLLEEWKLNFNSSNSNIQRSMTHIECVHVGAALFYWMIFDWMRGSCLSTQFVEICCYAQ